MKKIVFLLFAFIALQTYSIAKGHPEVSLCMAIPTFIRKPGSNSNTQSKVIARPTQLQKALHVATKFGAPADSSQFTERAIYDTLPLDGRTTFRFFEGCNARTFPRTNLSENKLQKQENMIIKYISLEAVTYSAGNTLPVTAVNALSAAFGQLYRSDLSIQVAQSVILKPMPMDGINPAFNPFAKHTAHNILRLGVDLTIPELLEFVANLQTVSYTPSTTIELMLKLHGQATIFSPRASF